MTEKQKMLAGLAYDSRDTELLDLYHNARSLLRRLNHIDSRDTSQRQHLLEQLLGSVGEHVWLETPFFCDYGELIFIGHNTFIHGNCTFIDNHTITIGNNSLIGPSVQIYTASHPLQASERVYTDPSHPNKTRYKTYSSPVKIGHNTWIGGNSIILPGVTIGDNTTIGAGSVVASDIPSGVLAVGNPCRVVGPLENREPS
ncbi:sugar O-acetyltransferase [Aureispira sp. CCB-E]|uniref:sugar O-acetyltransferase n=1 Tax=Aureispira sp. CCB-E TaxID=3051121 RepID=UPI002868B5EE|nr:sugar O-acetyltransferase [Aureispira sp. CCB-E]WMX17178.1 sugar O-acetyltransferase [Aureispira sp. CCB-E]